MEPNSMETAPRDGSEILLLADLASDCYENGFRDWFFGCWDPSLGRWDVFPAVPGTRIDEAHGWLPIKVLDLNPDRNSRAAA